MKRKTYKQLLNFVKTGDFDSGFVMHELFKKYNQIEGFDLDNMEEYIKDFFHVALKNKVQRKISKTIKNLDYNPCDIREDLDDIRCAISAFYDESIKIRNHSYVDLVRLCTKSGQHKILDVGAGAIPYSSILLAQSGFDSHCMDRIILADQTMQKYGVTSHDEYFNQNTDVSEFDMVVGRRPCDAIKAIVVNCSKRYKPFLMELCHCSFHKEAKQNGKIYLDWDEVFYDVNPKIQVYNGYAYFFGNGKDSYVEDAIDSCNKGATLQDLFIDFETAITDLFQEINQFLFSEMVGGKASDSFNVFRYSNIGNIIVSEDDDDDCLGD